MIGRYFPPEEPRQRARGPAVPVEGSYGNLDDDGTGGDYWWIAPWVVAEVMPEHSVRDGFKAEHGELVS